MNQLLEWAPLLAFFVVFKLFGIYWATGTLMVASIAVLLIHRRSTGKYKTIHVITAVVVLTLGTATLVLHDKRFIQWKPTILFGAAAIAFLGSFFIGRQPLARRMLAGVFNEPLEVTPRAWSVLNGLWVLWFAALAAINIYVAREYSEAVWVNFKVFGLTLAMIVFMIPQVLWLNGKTRQSPNAIPKSPVGDEP
jgi:intracellular septation protein